jgi:hypothetical protein
MQLPGDQPRHFPTLNGTGVKVLSSGDRMEGIR